MNRTLLSWPQPRPSVSATTLLPSRADAMSVGSAAAMQMTVEDMSARENAAYVCRHYY